MDEAFVFIIDDRFDAEDVVDWIGQDPICTRAELWAAIELVEDSSWTLGHKTALERADESDLSRLARARSLVRGLLGMETES